jgi:hypothetical protein
MRRSTKLRASKPPKPQKPPTDPDELIRRQRAADETTESRPRPEPKPKTVAWLSRLWQRNKA